MFKKILLALGVLIVLVLAAAITLPIIYKDDIIAKVKSTINDNVNAEVKFGDFSVSHITQLPESFL